MAEATRFEKWLKRDKPYLDRVMLSSNEYANDLTYNLYEAYQAAEAEAGVVIDKLILAITYYEAVLGGQSEVGENAMETAAEYKKQGARDD